MSGNKPIRLFDSCEFQRNFLLELWSFVTTLHCRHAHIKPCLCHIMPYSAGFHAKSSFQQPIDFLQFKTRTNLLEKFFHSDPRVWLFPPDIICLLGSSWAKQILVLTQDNTQWGVIILQASGRCSGIRPGSGMAHLADQSRRALWSLLPLPALCSV